ncbi:MAG: hypothetical protein AAF518_26520 [Spirochaetota bacterium]
MATFQPGDILDEALNWENFKLTLFGSEVIKFTQFEISYDADVALNTGKGGEPVSWAVKSYKREAKATLHIDEMKTLISAASVNGGDVLKLPPAPVTASCLVPKVGTFSLVIPAVKIKKASYSFKVGDDKVEVPIDFAVISYPIISFA